MAAATAGMPTGTSTAPFITVGQKEALQRELRRRSIVRIGWIGVASLVGLAALHLVITRLVFRAPSAEALQDYAQALGVAVVPLYSSAQQPLQLAGTTVSRVERIDSSRRWYTAEVRLELRQPLYAPAMTNGTILYRQLQQSLQVARERDLKHNLISPEAGPQAPDMPILIQMTHRAGEPLIVRVPFEARRFGWTWRIEPPQLMRRVANRTFEGSAIERYGNVPHIVFGPRNSMTEIRRRMRDARTYIVAVTKLVQRSADAEAIVEIPGVDPSMADAPALDPGMPDPDAPAIDPDAPAIDPDAPALDPELPPAVDPNAEAIDPTAPAVRFNR